MKTNARSFSSPRPAVCLGVLFLMFISLPIFGQVPGIESPFDPSASSANVPARHAAVKPKASTATTPSYSVAGLWLDAFGFTWNLSVNGSDAISGTVDVTNGCSPSSWTVTGQASGDQFSMTANVPSNVSSPPLGDCVSFEYDMTFTGENSAQGPWKNLIGSGGGSVSMTHSAPSYVPPPVILLDPVPDLLDPANVTTDPATLASNGRVVNGIEADGIAQLVLRIPVQAGNDQVTAKLFSDQCSDPSSCSPSSSSSDDGGLFPIGSTSTSLASTATARLASRSSNAPDDRTNSTGAR